MKVYDKASWHIDAGENKEEVLKKFTLIFSFLSSRKMLSEEGEEILDLGVNLSISLHERLLTDEGNTFIESIYDKLINSTSEELESNLNRV